MGDWEGVRLGLCEGVSLGVSVPLALSELVWLALAPKERAGVGVGEAVAEREDVRVPLGEPVLDLLGVRVLEAVLEPEEPLERDEVGEREVVLELESLGRSLGLRGVWLPLVERVCVGVFESDDAVLGLAPRDSVPVGVVVLLGVRVVADEREGVPVRVGVRVRVRVPLGRGAPPPPGPPAAAPPPPGPPAAAPPGGGGPSLGAKETLGLKLPLGACEGSKLACRLGA